MDSFNLIKNDEQKLEAQKKAEEGKNKISLDTQKKVLDSLEKQDMSKEQIDSKLKTNNKFMEDDWNKQSYREHKQRFMDGYYQNWEANDETTYKEKLAEIENVKITDQLKGDFNKQEQPGERFWYKSRKNEKRKIREYEDAARDEDKQYLHYSKNTVREMAALEKYATYHKDYFDSRDNLRTIYRNYVRKDTKPVEVQNWKKIYDRQIKAHGKLMGALTGTWKGLYQRGLDLVNDFRGDTGVTRKEEMDKGLRPFFSMTKKVLFWRKQVGLLGTETKEERDDGSEYNKRIMKQYQENKDGGRTKVMDELAKKLIKFQLKPEMFTNKYLASNMLKMQRYTDMLNSFVFLTQCNPNYLDMNSEDHTNPDLAAAIWSRIILLAPIMKGFMEKHAQFNGYSKGNDIENASRVKNGLTDDEKKNAFTTNEAYDKFVTETWNAVRKAYNSTIDYMDDAADVKISSYLKDAENKAEQKRQEKNAQKNDFNLKYDKDGTRSQELQDIKDGILENPLVYDLFGGEIDQLFKKVNEQMRRLDEIIVRKEALVALKERESIADKSVGLQDFETIWREYIEKETTRIDSEMHIINKQLTNYKAAINFFTGLKLNDKDLTIDAEPSVKNVLKYEGLDHVFNLKDAFEYNDMFYKTMNYYDFDKFTEIKNKNGEVTTQIKDMWAQYNYTLLKRGIKRARYVNKLVDGKMAVDINNPDMLNNISRRKTAIENYKKYEKQYGSIEADYNTLLAIKPSEISEKIGINKELDITKEETFKTYFWLKNIVALFDKLEYEKTAPKGYNNYTYEQKLDIRVKGRLFRDYFHKWDGVIQYTMSEAYEYVYDTSSIEGNNQVIDGIDKNYRLKTLTEMHKNILGKMDEYIKKNPEVELAEDKLYTIERDKDKQPEAQQDKDKDPEQAKIEAQETLDKHPEYKKLVEMEKFLKGMMEANNYDAKGLKLIDENAYEAYKAELFKDDKVKRLREIYNEDFNKLVEDGLAFDTKKDREAYLDRIDTALELQEKCEYFVKNKKKCLSKIGIDVPNDASLNKNYIELQFTIKKQEKIDQAKKSGKYKDDKNYELSNKEKSDYIKNYADKFKAICKKVKEEYCTDKKLDDKKIVSNITSILTDLDFVEDFVTFNHQLYLENTDLVLLTYSSKDLEKMGEQEVFMADFSEYVNMLLADYGISKFHNYNFTYRHDIKQDIVKTDKELSSDYAQLEKEKKTFNKNELEWFKKRDENKARLNEVTKLRNQDLSTKKLLPKEEMERLYKNGDDSVEMKMICNAPAYRFKSQYDEEYKALIEERDMLDRSFKEQSKELELLIYYQHGALDETIKKKESDEKGKKSDWILLRKQSRQMLIEKNLEKQEKPEPRNCVEELFEYIYKKASDIEFLDHDKITDILTKATQTYFFTLSARAKKEAEMRLRIFKKDKSVMSDYFIWKNNRDSEGVLIERCKVFGQDEFVKQNIKTIKNIMNVIAESNAAVNDMQNPMFLDALKEDLTMKGIDEKQFMFLLRRHDVGFAGKAVNRADAYRAEKNVNDASDYLQVETKDEFLLRTSEDVLELGKELDLKKINEEYIIKNFDKCYFNANKLLAFQQLYYGEKENFDKLYNKRGCRGTIQKVRTYFDKGHGESYALYYNAVVSVANKFGITEKGGLSFGLTQKEIDILRDENKKEEHKKLQEQATKNREAANKAYEYNLSTIKTAYEETALANEIRNAVSGSLVSVPLEDRIKVGDKKKMVTVRDNYGLDTSSKEQASALEKFYNEYTDAYNGANRLYQTFKEQEDSTIKVNYTVSSSFQPKMMFLLAPDENISYASGKINATGTCNNFKNLINDDVESIGANLSVIDEEKCNNVINMVKDLKLDMGKISEGSGKEPALFDEAFFDKQLKENPKFYVNMVNAMNLCIIFEANPDILRINDYKKNVESGISKYTNNMQVLGQWDKAKKLEKEYITAREESAKLEEQLRKLKDEQDSIEMQMARLKLASENPKENELKLKDLTRSSNKLITEISELESKAKAALEKKNKAFDAYDKADEELYKNGKIQAEKFNPDHLKASKVDTLTAVRDMFSNNKTRFMVSTYFDLFSAYLLKKGIKIDGSLVNAQIFDEVLDESKRSELGKENLERKDALDLGKMFSADMKGYSEELFKAKQDKIKSQGYLKEYASLEKLQKSIEKKEDGLVVAIKNSFVGILEKRNPKDKKKKKNTKPLTDAQFVFTQLTDDERFMLKKYGRVVSAKLSDEKGDDWFGLDKNKMDEITKYRKLIVLMDINEKIGNHDDSEGYGIAAALLTPDEKNILKSYKNEFKNKGDQYWNVDVRIDGFKAYVEARELASSQSHVK